MSVPITFNGVSYDIPEFRDTNYANELTQFFVAIPNGSLQPTGGLFTLLAEVDLGASYGLKSLYVKSRATHPAAAGIFRLGTAESVSWRTALNDGDVALTTDSSNNLTFNATKVLLSGAVVNADINASAAIAYSKLALTTSIVNGDINASAAIALTKLAATTASRALVSDGSGFVSVSAVTATELAYMSGVTSAVQTQLDSKVNDTGDTMTGALGIGGAPAASSLLTLTSTTKGLLMSRMTTTQRDAIVSPATGLVIYNTTTNLVNNYNGVAWVALTASGGGTVDAGSQYQLTYYAANGTTVSALPLITASSAVVSDANGLPVASAVTATELSYVSGVTSAIQTQMNLKAPLASPTFSGTITTALTASRALMTGATSELAVSAVTSTELGYLSGVSSAIQTQLNLLAPKANPTFTGTVTYPTPFTLGAVSVTATGTEMNYLVGVSSAIQTQFTSKAPLASPTFTGTVTIPTPFTLGAVSVTATGTELNYVAGVTSAIQTQMNLKAPLASPTFTGTVTTTSHILPASDGAADLGSGSFRFRSIFASSNILLGGTAARVVGGVVPGLQIEGLDAASARPSVTLNINSAAGAQLMFARSRGTVLGDFTILQNNDFIGGLNFLGANGSTLASQGAYIFASINGTPSSTSMPTRLEFATTAVGAVAATVALTIDAAQKATFAGVVSLPVGSASAPSINFGSSNSGIYGTFTTHISIASNGGQIIDFQPSLIAPQVQIQNIVGSASAPSYGFVTGSNNDGMYLVGAGDIGFTTGGTQRMHLTTSALRCTISIQPTADNTYGLGQTGERWTSVWAANGTIQTSMLETKTNVEYMEPDECKIPKAIYYNRPNDNHSYQQLGFEANILPEEAHPVVDEATGERAKDDIYTSSVIAMLCQAARNDYERLKENDARIAALEAQIAKLLEK